MAQPVKQFPVAQFIASADDTVNIAVHDLGGSGRPVLVSHATGFHARCYEPLAAALPDGLHAIGIDHRGHGYTEAAAGWVLDWAAFGADIVTVAQRLADDGPLIGFGHSMGGSALLLAAAKQPELFDSLVLFEPIAPSGFLPNGVPPAAVDGYDNPVAQGALRRRPDFSSVDEAIENFAAKPPLALMTPAALRAYVEHGFAPAANGITLRCRPEFEAATYAAASTNGVWEALPDIATKVLIVRGQLDGTAPADWAESIADRLANGTIHADDEQTHFGPFSHPARNAALIETAAVLA